MKSLTDLRTGAVAVAAALALAGSARAADAGRPPYLDPAQPVEARVDDLLGRLTLDEKIALVHGDSKFTVAAIPRLGIPRRWLSDGPHGVREDVGPDTFKPANRTDDFATYLPVAVALASTWNPDAARAYGNVIGEEARRRGKDIMLGPGVNIQRTPLNGRTFEYLGEDPFLASRMAVSYIKAVQSHDVSSCVKHFACNSQETERNTVDVQMDERTLHEIYLPAFKAAVQEAGVWCVMGAYNRFRGQQCCENDYLLNQVLKTQWGFKGVVISDWNGTHNGTQAVLGGLDLEMGTAKPYADYYLARQFKEGIEKGAYPMSVLDDKVRRNLRVMFALHFLESRPEGSLNTAAHQETAQRVAEEGMVLLKNAGGALPLDAGAITSIAVIGENAVRLQAHGGGSTEMKALHEITPLEGLIRHSGGRINFTYSQGYGKEAGVAAADRAVRAAKAADVALVVAGLNHERTFDCEGADRNSLDLPYGQDELIRRVAQANPRTVVVLVSGSPVRMGAWLDQVPAVLQAWYAGCEGGRALARVLFGDVNPSGKLPCTFPKKLADSPAYALGAYPGKGGIEPYTEGLLVGYRWFDTKGIEPLFPFGHGLSYTSFAYSDLRLVAGTDSKGPVVTVEFKLTNTGSRAGAEVAQVYVHQAKPSLQRPLRELKGFRKVALKPGERQAVSIPLAREAFAFYDAEKAAWVAEKDDFEIAIGSSSRDLRLRGNFSLPVAATWK